MTGWASGADGEEEASGWLTGGRTADRIHGPERIAR